MHELGKWLLSAWPHSDHVGGDNGKFGPDLGADQSISFPCNFASYPSGSQVPCRLIKSSLLALSLFFLSLSLSIYIYIPFFCFRVGASACVCC